MKKVLVLTFLMLASAEMLSMDSQGSEGKIVHPEYGEGVVKYHPVTIFKNSSGFLRTKAGCVVCYPNVMSKTSFYKDLRGNPVKAIRFVTFLNIFPNVDVQLPPMNPGFDDPVVLELGARIDRFLADRVQGPVEG